MPHTGSTAACPCPYRQANLSFFFLVVAVNREAAPATHVAGTAVNFNPVLTTVSRLGKGPPCLSMKSRNRKRKSRGDPDQQRRASKPTAAAATPRRIHQFVVVLVMQVQCREKSDLYLYMSWWRPPSPALRVSALATPHENTVLYIPIRIPSFCHSDVRATVSAGL